MEGPGLRWEPWGRSKPVRRGVQCGHVECKVPRMAGPLGSCLRLCSRGGVRGLIWTALRVLGREALVYWPMGRSKSDLRGGGQPEYGG